MILNLKYLVVLIIFISIYLFVKRQSYFKIIIVTKEIFRTKEIVSKMMPTGYKQII